jgi:hypothetical protein
MRNLISGLISRRPGRCQPRRSKHRNEKSLADPFDYVGVLRSGASLRQLLKSDG